MRTWNLPLVSNTDGEILVVQTNIGVMKLRVINAYGPQEMASNRENVLKFWQNFEKAIIVAKKQNWKILVQIDANAKLGCEIIRNDPHKLSDNGVILFEIITRQNLAILNAETLCEGVTLGYWIILFHCCVLFVMSVIN